MCILISQDLVTVQLKQSYTGYVVLTDQDDLE